MIALAVAVLITFAGGLYFISHNRPSESPILPHQNKGQSNGLPPKPEERWRYIKELENRQPGVLAPTEPSAGGEIASPGQLTEEQRQLLEQMQADMRRQPTPLTEVPYNDQTQVPRSQVIVKPPTVAAPPPAQNSVTAPPAAVRAPTAATQQPAATAPRPRQETAKQPEPAKPEKAQRWMIQCGSFKTMEPAESVRAELAFAGIESRITSNGGWNRVVLGPYGSRAAADGALQRLKGIGAANCIPLAGGG